MNFVHLGLFKLTNNYYAKVNSNTKTLCNYKTGNKNEKREKLRYAKLLWHTVRQEIPCMADEVNYTVESVGDI